MNTLICIDPGQSGGLAVKYDGQPVQTFPMPPTEGDLLCLLRQLSADPASTLAVVEEVSGFVGKAQPGSSAFKFGRGFGFALGCIQALGVRLELVRPAKWQKPLGLGTASTCASKVEWKNKLKARAQQLFPGIRVTLKTADALLILDYALRFSTSRPVDVGRVIEKSPVTL